MPKSTRTDPFTETVYAMVFLVVVLSFLSLVMWMFMVTVKVPLAVVVLPCAYGAWSGIRSLWNWIKARSESLAQEVATPQLPSRDKIRKLYRSGATQQAAYLEELGKSARTGKITVDDYVRMIKDFERTRRSTEDRVGDEERDLAIAELGKHFAAGRLDMDEYHTRLTIISEAKVLSTIQGQLQGLKPEM